MKKDTVLGAPVGAKKRIVILLLFPVAVVFLLLYLITGLFRMPEEEEVTLPSGNLSANVFEAQNMTYTKNTAFPNEQAFLTIPYKVDVPDGATATVGDAKVITSNGFYLAYGETTDLEKFLKAGYTPILSIHSDENETVLTSLVKEEGYLNGCAATFEVFEISNPKAQTVMYLSSYLLKPTAESYKSDRSIVISCMAEGKDNFSNSQVLAETMCRTLRYDDELAKKLGEVK